MKKYILMFGLTLVMGLFISNTVDAQWTSGGGISWTNDNVGIGASDPGANESLLIRRTSAGQAAIQEMTLEGFQGASLIFRKARGTTALRTVPQVDDIMGGLFGQVYHGSTWRPAATLRFFVDGPVSTGSTPGRIEFQTQPVGSSTAASLQTRMIVDNQGRVAVGFTDMSKLGSSLFGVNGKLLAEEVEVKLFASWPDFVFQDNFDLMPLNELESFISTNRHLPGVPTEADVTENGVNLGQMTGILLQKVEEMTLHIIDLNKRIAELEGR